FLFNVSPGHRDLHSFPTRRSSDLDADQGLDHTLPFGDETGQRKWLRVLGTRELQEGGQTRIYGTLQDVTKIQNVTQELLVVNAKDRKSTRLNSSHVKISYAVFCLK